MKALLVNGSPRKEGNTSTALAEVAKALESEGVAAETFWIGAKPVRGCAACGACKRNGDGQCAFGDDACNVLIGRRRGGSTAAFQCLNMPFQMLNCVLPGSQYWNVAFGREPGQAALDAEGMQTMRTLGRNIAWLLKNLRDEGAIPPPAPEPWQPMHFIR